MFSCTHTSESEREMISRLDELHRFKPGYSDQEVKLKEIFAPMGPETNKEATSIPLSLVWVYFKTFPVDVE